jgi:uncharacterized protein
MKAPPLPVPAPERSPETEPFWEGTAAGLLRLAHCDTCNTVIWYPKTYCSECGDRAVSWVEASGNGTIYSFTVVRRGTGAFRDAAPFVVAFVELVEGPRVLTNIVGCDPDEVSIGLPVSVVFFDTGEGCALYRFAPSDAMTEISDG